ncbi:MAG TPA: SDR family oxidoreductase [Flavobacteriales bacterium]
MEQRTVVVTGASRGIGRATALELAVVHGCRVFAVARDAEALAALVREAADRDAHIVAVGLDLALPDAPVRLAEVVGPERVTALINDAGLLIKRPFGEWTIEDGQRLFHLNAVVPLLLAQALAPAMAGTPGAHIVNIGSMGGFQGSSKFPGLALYSASKGALATVTECLAEEFRTSGVRCNCLCIGAVDTVMLREAFPGYEAPVSAATMGAYVAGFALEGHKLFNGKVLPVSVSTP